MSYNGIHGFWNVIIIIFMNLVCVNLGYKNYIYI